MSYKKEKKIVEYKIIGCMIMNVVYDRKAFFHFGRNRNRPKNPLFISAETDTETEKKLFLSAETDTETEKHAIG